MVSIDTNILVRLLTGDDAAQCQKAHQIFVEHEIFLHDTVILETEWVLRFAYQFTPAVINTAFIKLLGLANVRFTRPDMMAKAMEWHRQGLDFADALHLAASSEQSLFLTFDAKLVKKAKGMAGCRVESP